MSTYGLSCPDCAGAAPVDTDEGPYTCPGCGGTGKASRHIELEAVGGDEAVIAFAQDLVAALGQTRHSVTAYGGFDLTEVAALVMLKQHRRRREDHAEARG